MTKRISYFSDLIYENPCLIQIKKDSKIKLKHKKGTCFLYLCKYYGNKGYVLVPKHIHKKIKKVEGLTLYLHVYMSKGVGSNLSRKEYLRKASYEFLSKQDFEEKKKEYYIERITSNNICY